MGHCETFFSRLDSFGMIDGLEKIRCHKLNLKPMARDIG